MNLRSILEEVADWGLHHMNKPLAIDKAYKDILSLLPEEKEATYIDSPEAIELNNRRFLEAEGHNNCLSEVKRRLG